MNMKMAANHYYSRLKITSHWHVSIAFVCLLLIFWMTIRNHQHHGEQAPCRTSVLEWRMLAGLRHEMTVVVAYFNIGLFPKGETGGYYVPEDYNLWMTALARLESPLVAYFDTEDSVRYFTEIRRRQLPANWTRIIKLDRQQMWSFQLEPEIAKIFAKPGYPKHHPNTVVAGYPAAMHAKYEVMQLAIRDNPFRTRYFCWLDIGLFRDLVREGQDAPKFSMYLPPDFQQNSIAYSQVVERNPSLSARRIVYKNLVWVSGSCFVGRLDMLYRWTEEYQEAVLKSIADGATSTDQQIIYIAFNTMNVNTRIQEYRAPDGYSVWNFLGWTSRVAGAARKRELLVNQTEISAAKL